jgi:hypothetical protein
MKFLFFTLLAQIVISAPLLSQIFGPGGLAEVDLSGMGVLSPSSDTTKVNINKGYGNYIGPQHAPATAPGFGSPQQFFNTGFHGAPPAQGFLQSGGNQLRGPRA